MREQLVPEVALGGIRCFVRDASLQLQSNRQQLPLRFSGIRGDGQRAWDWSLFKTFPLNERVRLQFRAEVYNALNQASFNTPNRNPTTHAKGRGP